MHILRIPKGKGKFRIVYSPESHEKSNYVMLARRLAQLERLAACNVGIPDIAHGFIKGRSPVTAALQHVKCKVTISCDIQDFYDSVTAVDIQRGLEFAGLEFVEREDLANRACYVGAPESYRPYLLAPRQGLPSSPAASNLAAIALDLRIKQGLDELGMAYQYTRYADDLTVSLVERDDRESVDSVLALLAQSVESMRWRLAHSKTSVQRQKGGNRVILGIAVGDKIVAPRQTRRRLRAAQHQKRGPQARGLREWCALKLPQDRRPLWEKIFAILRGESTVGDCESLAVVSDLFEENGMGFWAGLARKGTHEARRIIVTRARQETLQ